MPEVEVLLGPAERLVALEHVVEVLAEIHRHAALAVVDGEAGAGEDLEAAPGAAQGLLVAERDRDHPRDERDLDALGLLELRLGGGPVAAGDLEVVPDDHSFNTTTRY